MNKIYLFFLILIIFSSCKESNEATNGTEKIDLSSILENPEKDKIFHGVRYIKLESNPEILLGENLFFETRDDKIYILDREDQNAVLVFNNEGKFISKVGKAGGGPEEYIQGIDFLVRNDTVDFLVYAGTNSIIYSYTSSGSFIKKLPLEYLGFSFALVKDNHYAISTNYNKAVHDHQVYLLDLNGGEKGKFLPNNTEVMNTVTDCFNKCSGQVFYYEPFNNHVYAFDDLQLKPVIEFDFGRYNIPESFYQEETIKSFGPLNKKGFSIIKSVSSNDKYFLIEIFCQQEGMPTKMFDIFYNKKTHGIKYIMFGEDDQIFRYPIGLNDKDEMMYLVFPIGDINEKAKQFGLDLDLKNFSESDNPVVMFCKI